MPTATKEQDVKDLSVIYDRVYNIADRLFKKYNPCNIHTEGDKVICNGGDKPSNTLCCYECSPDCGLRSIHYWDNGCTIKCLGCKLFLCPPVIRKYPLFYERLYRLHTIAYKYSLPHGRYYFPKEKWLKQIKE